ncbi:hypothetical protein Hanom_Chr03g00204031 [Helianthus anomalus]
MDEDMYERLRRRMLELANDCQTTSYGSVSSSGVWKKHQDDVSFEGSSVRFEVVLLDFWSELPPQARQELLRIDKQTPFEQARKNMYCSRCNGLLLEGFMQIVMYGKSLHQDGMCSQGSGNRLVTPKSHIVENVCLTSGCLYFIVLELGSGNVNYFLLMHVEEEVVGGLDFRQRARETCALHTARLSVDTLVDFCILRSFEGTYTHYEWPVGTGAGKSDILDFENVGPNTRVQVNGLDLDGLNSCYITLRAWRTDGRCHEVSVKAHALNGQQCVHGRLVVGDGYVTITRGESVRRFFEHAGRRG